MIMFFKKILEKKCSLEKAIVLLEKCAKAGDIRAQQMLSLYKSCNFSPLQDNFSALKHADIIKCIKTKPIKKARNPSTSSIQGKKHVKSQTKKSKASKIKSKAKK